MIATIDIEIVMCASCGIPFGITRDLVNRRREDHSDFKCPMGHENVYQGKTEAEKLKEQLAEALAAKERAYQRESHALRQVSYHKGETTKIKNRIKNGVCPSCRRSFENLRRHMASKHKETP